MRLLATGSLIPVSTGHAVRPQNERGATMAILWLGMAILLLVGAVVVAYKHDNPMARLGLYCIAGAAGIWLIFQILN